MLKELTEINCNSDTISINSL